MQLKPNNTRVKVPEYNISDVREISTTTNQFDGLSPNSEGRDRLDINDIPIKLLSCKQYINIATMNVRTLRKTTKRQEIAELASKCQISILGLIDHKIVHDDDETKIEKYGEYIYSPYFSFFVSSSRGGYRGGLGGL